MHAGAVAAELELPTVVVPMGDVSSLWSTFGAATSDLGVTVEVSINEMEPFDRARLTAALDTLRDRARHALGRAGWEKRRALPTRPGCGTARRSTRSGLESQVLSRRTRTSNAW